jgi:hypothetical protein
VVRDLLGGTEKVLDVGTGGDEKLVHLADAFGSARASTSGSTFATAHPDRPACRIHLSKWCSTGTRLLTYQRSPEC